jgi:hypothetical protein
MQPITDRDLRILIAWSDLHGLPTPVDTRLAGTSATLVLADAADLHAWADRLEVGVDVRRVPARATYTDGDYNFHLRVAGDLTPGEVPARVRKS